jgi:GDP-L-fucose synthase
MFKNMENDSKIYVAGHRGLVGSALVRVLRSQGFTNIVTATHEEVDLTNHSSVTEYFWSNRPEYVFLAAAKVGGVCSNNGHEAEFLLQNMQIQNNVIQASGVFNVKKLLFLGSACIYPRLAPEPVLESSLLTGPLEPSNQWYALAKISGLRLCQAYRRQYGSNFISLMPCNLFGPGDYYNLESCHVLPALIRRFHEAKLRGDKCVTCWGSGKPLREFLYSDDLAHACVLAMEKYNGEEPLNVSPGQDVSIKELAELIEFIVGFEGEIKWDTSKPDGTPRRRLDTTGIRTLGWTPLHSLNYGLRLTYEDFKKGFRE